MNSKYVAYFLRISLILLTEAHVYFTSLLNMWSTALSC